MKLINNLLLIITILILTGCTTLGEGVKDVPSIANSGTTSVEVKPVFAKPGEVQVGIEYKAIFAKAYDNFDASLTFDDNGNITGLTIGAGGVKAFKGQEAAHDALVKKTTSLRVSVGAVENN